MLRNNAYSRYQPDPYGNGTNSLAPPGTVKPTNNKDARDKTAEIEGQRSRREKKKFDKINANKTVQDAHKSIEHLKDKEAPVKEHVDLDPLSTTLGAGTAALSGYKQGKDNISSNVSTGGNYRGYKSEGGGMSRRQWRKSGKPSSSASNPAKGGSGAAVAGAGVAAGSAVLGMVGNNLSANGKEDVGGTMSGIGSGASLGMSIGSMVPGGAFIGAGVGAVVGGIAGFFGGKGKKAKRERAEKKEAQERAAYNAKIAEIKRKTVSKAKDLSKYQKIVNSAARYDSRGNLKYKKGGLLPYATLNVGEAKSYLSELEASIKTTETPKRRITSAIDKFKEGGKVETKITKVVKESKPAVKVVPTFRRGGKLDLAKGNVIVGGPSHDDLNNTGVDGDKGIPVVKDGIKVAEIESEELILRREAVEKIEALTEKAKNDPKAKAELGKIIKKELLNNTYDYSKEK